MKQVVFKRISAEGFGSLVAPVTFLLNRGSINMVKGKNGHGKTTIFSALSWCLHKVNLKGVNNDKVVTWERYRTAEWRGTRVIVEWSVPGDNTDYMVARHIDFKGTTKSYKGKSTLMIFQKPSDKPEFEPSDMVGQEQYKDDQQGFINRALGGLDSRTFLNSVLFGQKMKRLVEAENDEKRKVFETLFDLDFVPLAKKAAELKLSEENAKLEKLKAVSDNANASLTGMQQQLDKNLKVIDQFEVGRKQALDQLASEGRVKEYQLAETRAAIQALQTDVDAFDDNLLQASQARHVDIGDRLVKAKADFQQIGEKLRDEFRKSFDEVLECLKKEKYAHEAEKDKFLTARRGAELMLGQYQQAADDIAREIRAGKVKDAEHEVKEKSRLLAEAEDAVVALRNNVRLASIDVNQFKSEIQAAEGKIQKWKQELADPNTTMCPGCQRPVDAGKIEEIKARYKKLIDSEQEVVDVLREKAPTAIAMLEELKAEQTALEQVVIKHEMAESEAQSKLKLIVDQFSAVGNPQYEDALKTVADVQLSIKQHNAMLTMLDSRIVDIQVNIDAYQASKQQKWEAVLQGSEDLKKANLEVDNLTRLLADVKVSLDDLSAKGQKSMQAKAELPVKHERVNGLLDALQRIEKSMQAERDKKAPEVEIQPLRDKIDAVIKQLEDSKAEIEAVTARAEDFSWWAKTGFGSSGLKAFVFNTGLKLLNQASEKYASRLGVRLEFSVDLSKTSKPFVTKVFKDGAMVDYGDLSGGEQQRLNVATAFAMHDLISSTSNVNLLILDEIFESLDQDGIEEVFDLIRTKAGDSRTVYVVTHINSIDALNTKTIEIFKGADGNSVIN